MIGFETLVFKQYYGFYLPKADSVIEILQRSHTNIARLYNRHEFILQN